MGISFFCFQLQPNRYIYNIFIKRFAESIYLDQGDIESSLNMYKKLQKWDDAIKLANQRGYADIDTLREQQMSYLISSGQEEKAGQILEEKSDTDRAMSLYLKAKQPIKAARLMLKIPQLLQNEELVGRVTAALVKAGKIPHVFLLLAYQLFEFYIYFVQNYLSLPVI